MDWVILLFGVLIGWGGEWLIDFFYWRRRHQGTLAALEQADGALITAQEENQQLRKKLVELEEMPASVPVAAQQIYAVAADDLTIIEGIGDKTADLLNQNSITTFEQLASTDVHRIRGILHDGGTEFQLHDPTTWPRQARLATNRDWVKLAALKAELVGGVPQNALDLEDDLTRIEGIGPKVATLLNAQGIHSYAHLSKTQSSQLHTFLESAGPTYHIAIASAETWPEQARLAAQGRWQELLSLQDELKGGRTAPSSAAAAPPQ
jgi:predicted flap endonuclease-1-like 5' DNA nuclease